MNNIMSADDKGVWVHLSAETANGLLSRFLVNLPVGELNDANRIFYHLEHMWWFFLDHYCASLLPVSRLRLSNHAGSFRQFASQMFSFLGLPCHGPDILPLHKQYLRYKRCIPVAGCIVLDVTASEVLMVKPAGCKNWTFPKGKQNAGETLSETAIRETWEETGFDLNVTPQLSPWLEWSFKTPNSLDTRLFVVLVRRRRPPEPPPRFARVEIDKVQWTSVNNASKPPLTSLGTQAWAKLQAYLRMMMLPPPEPVAA